MITTQTLQEFNLGGLHRPVSRRDYTMTITRLDGVTVPVVVAERTTNARWYHWAGLLLAVGLGLAGVL